MTNTIVIPTNKFSTNILCILIRRNLSREEVTATALLPQVLSRGSVRYPTVQDIRLAAESMQGSIFDAQIVKKGEQQILQFFIEFPANPTGDMAFKSQVLDFLQDIILNPLTESKKSEKTANESFSFTYVRGEKDNLRNRIQGRINNKSEYTNLKCLEAMCKNEPFGLYGDGYEEDLSTIDPKNLLSHYHDIRANSPVDFIALGTWDENWLKEEISKRFNIFSDNAVIPKASLSQARANRQTIHLDHGISQGNLCIGLRCEIEPSGKDAINLLLANEILGVGPGAKLFTSIREKESLCYSIYSNLYRFKSLMCISAGTEPDKLEQVLALAEKEIESLQKGEISDSELHNAKQSLSKRWLALLDNPACVDFYTTQYLLNDSRTIEQMLNDIEASDKTDIINAASQLKIDTVVMAK